MLRNIRKVAREPELLVRPFSQAIIERRKRRLDLHQERAASCAWLSQVGGQASVSHLQEYETSPFASWFAERRTALHQIGQSPGTSSRFDLVTLYLAVRALHPRVVVETGVLNGASSGHILAALRANGDGGVLYSIDLPLHGRDQTWFVPEAYRRQWTLINGDSTVELPALLNRLGEIDQFHHDSLHTRNHMLWEYRTAFPSLRAGGVLSSHDVVSSAFRGNVYASFCQKQGISYGIFRNVGIGIRHAY